MSQTATPEQAATPHNAKRSAALFSVLAALGVTLLKLLTGLLTGSLGMLSEAAHSGIDLIAAGITLFSVQVSDRPADASHTYGHGKIESLSAAVEAVLMLASCVWIFTEAIRRIVFRERLTLNLSIWPFIVLLLAITVDFTRSRKLHRIAAETRSEALEADANILERLDTLPTFAPFLLRDLFSRAQIAVDPKYTEIPEAEWQEIRSFIRERFKQVLSAVSGKDTRDTSQARRF